MRCLVCGEELRKNVLKSWMSTQCYGCGETWIRCGEGLRRWNEGYRGWDVAEEGCMRVHGELPGGRGEGLDGSRIEDEGRGWMLERGAGT